MDRDVIDAAMALPRKTGQKSQIFAFHACHGTPKVQDGAGQTAAPKGQERQGLSGR